MAFETGLDNKPTPIKNLGQESGRLVKENDKVVNVADWLDLVTTPGSGLTVNVDVTAEPGSGTGVSIESFRKNSRVLFKSDFSVGLDTFRTWSGRFLGALLLTESDTSASDGNNIIGPAEVAKNRIPLFFEPQTILNDSSPFVLASKNVPRFNSTQGCFHYFQALFEHEGVTTNTQTYSIVVTQNSVDVEVDKASWNIDTLDGSGPSGIDIDFSKIQTFFIYIPSKDTGDIKFGFFINNELHYVHEHKLNNSELYATSPPWGNLNLPVRVSVEKTGANILTYEYGLFDLTDGIKFVAKMDTTNEPAITVKKYLHSVSSYSYGGVENNTLYRPFSIGNREVLKNVLTATEIPLITIRNCDVFNGNVNKVSYSLRALEFYNKNVDLLAGCLFRVRYDVTLSVEQNFISVGINSSVDFDISALTIVTLPSETSVIYEKIVFPNNSFEINFTDDDMINTVVNEFSLTTMPAKEGDLIDRPFLTITATPISGVASVDVGATFRWVEKY